MKALCAFSLVLLTGCSAPPAMDDSTYGASVGIVNHTGNFIYSASANGGGGHMEAWGAGGPNVCCVMIPRKWYPGMKVPVRWDMPEGSKHIYKEKIVEVEQYDDDDGGSLYIHIFPNGEVRLVVSRYAGWSSKHPIPAPVNPDSKAGQSQ
ncbi:DUF3304 domain-containing protein [Pseudoduganella violaceinigra]|uniref:DUF3304 domain-containing protein n=1 Tax=Pseudoduganella violaceinigra TaxID=246602 RepID=UPI000A01082F|nr:DUF3304 domain-containing protein [Pseudoduganella violaceinigra]